MNRFVKFFSPAAVAVAALALGAGTANASPHPTHGGIVPFVVTTDHAGIAGYYANNDGKTRIRDAKAVFVITAEMEQLANTPPTNPLNGAVGVDLCNPNNRQAMAAAVSWVPGASSFEFRYNSGFLATGPSDPCVTGLGNLEPGALEFPGNVNHITGSAPVVGDKVSVEVYYNPATTEVTLTACDITQDTCSETHVRPGAENWREAGVGVLDDLAIEGSGNCLVPPAINNVVNFSFARFTRYTATGSGLGLAGFDIHSVTGLNASNNSVLVPSGLSGSHSSQFSVNAGISTCV